MTTFSCLQKFFFLGLENLLIKTSFASVSILKFICYYILANIYNLKLGSKSGVIDIIKGCCLG